MAYLASRISSDSQSAYTDAPFLAERPEAAPPSDADDVIAALRQSLSESTLPPSSIFHAVTEFARILTGASGIALAVRIKTMIVCRARSGDIAPELGAPLNGNSGISGECLRTAAVMLCNDVETDPRVDREACRALGIRSIVAVPLRGALGIFGILEAFSTGRSAFDREAIDALRGLAGIVEEAYSRECSTQPAAQPALPSARAVLSVAKSRPAVLQQPTVLPATPVSPVNATSRLAEEAPRRRRFWIPVIATATLLLTSAVAWFSWNGSTRELAAATAAQTTSRPSNVSRTAATPQPTISASIKPMPGIFRAGRSQSRAMLRNVAKTDNGGNLPDASGSIPPSTSSAEATPGVTTPGSPAKSSAVEMAEPGTSGQQPGLISTPPTPSIGIVASRGVTEPMLIHKVLPTYPAEARTQRVTGPVTVDATIDENGIVRDVKLVSGPPSLAVAAAEAVLQWSYRPSLLNGKPVQVHKQVTIVFKLP